MSYADAWNLQWKGALNHGGPVTILVDGVNEEFVEVTEGMDIEDEDLMLDMPTVISSIRSDRDEWGDRYGSKLPESQEWKEAIAMELDKHFIFHGSETRILVVDTNVLISRLSLCKTLVSHIKSTRHLNITLLIPGIVVQELDSLKCSNKTNIATRPDGTQQSVGVGKLARDANGWLLGEIKGKSECVRVQKEGDTPRPPSWKINRSELTNDDLILECAKFFVAQRDMPSENVMLLTCDQNLALKAFAEEIQVLSPSPRASIENLISDLYRHSPKSSALPIISNSLSQSNWSNSSLPLNGRSSGVGASGNERENAPGARPTSEQLQSPPPYSEHDMHPDSTVYSNGMGTHPLSILQQRVFEYLQGYLPSVVLEGIENEKYRRSRLNNDGIGRISTWRNGKLEDIEIPQGDEWKNWSLKESIIWLDKVLPSPTTRPSNAASVNKVAEFVTPVGQRGGRRGELWGRGDWNGVVQALRRFCPDSDMNELAEAVEAAFVNGTRYLR